jgi:hypothetical protein
MFLVSHLVPVIMYVPGVIPGPCDNVPGVIPGPEIILLVIYLVPVIMFLVLQTQQWFMRLATG